MKKSFLLLILVSVTSVFAESVAVREDYWDWEKLDAVVEAVKFPKSFVFGCGTAELQISGADNLPDSQWAAWERAGKVSASGKACDSLNRRTEDIALLKKMGVTAYRFSVDWSLIEPKEGEFKAEMLDHYRQFCDDLVVAGIKPVVTLHHFVHPQWFEEKGAFEVDDNITYFVRFSEKVFNALGKRVHMWCTINEPSVYPFQAYVHGVYPPGKVCNFTKAGTVLKNFMRAHVETYHTLKAIDQTAQIGIVHQALHFSAHAPWNVHGRAITAALNQFSDSVLNFLVTGKFKFAVPFKKAIEYDGGSRAMRCNDFIGLNYYSHVLMGLAGETYRSHEIRTDMPYSIYAEGIYHAIRDVAQLRLPIYITENGIADKTDTKRDLWIKRYLYAVHKALQEGYDVRGFFYWSLMDNYEWDMGYTQKFGLAAVNLETFERTIRPGAQRFINHALGAQA